MLWYLLNIAIFCSYFSSQKCVRSWLSCHSKVCSFWKCTVMLLHRHGWSAGPHIPFHTPVNVVWFCCHFLWWKVINPLRSPSPPNYLSSFQHPWSLEREHRGADRPLFIPGDMWWSKTAPGFSPLIRPFHKPHCRLLGLYPQSTGLWTWSSLYLFLFFYLFTEALPHSPPMKNLQI